MHNAKLQHLASINLVKHKMGKRMNENKTSPPYELSDAQVSTALSHLRKILIFMQNKESAISSVTPGSAFSPEVSPKRALTP